MKRLSIITILLFLGTMAFSQGDGITKYFEKYMDDEDFTVVYISGRMFGMFAEIEDDDKEAKAALKGLKGLRILTTDKKENTVKLYEEALKKFDSSEYEELMKVRDGKENVNFYIKEEDEKITELLLLVGGGDDFVLLSFKGNIDLKQISTLSESMDIDGLEHLEKVDE